MAPKRNNPGPQQVKYSIKHTRPAHPRPKPKKIPDENRNTNLTKNTHMSMRAHSPVRERADHARPTADLPVQSSESCCWCGSSCGTRRDTCRAGRSSTGRRHLQTLGFHFGGHVFGLLQGAAHPPRMGVRRAQGDLRHGITRVRPRQGRGGRPRDGVQETESGGLLPEGRYRRDHDLSARRVSPRSTGGGSARTT